MAPPADAVAVSHSPPLAVTVPMVSVPFPALDRATAGETAGAPCASLTVTWSVDGTTTGWEVTRMVTPMVLLSAAKLDPLVVIVPL